MAGFPLDPDIYINLWKPCEISAKTLEAIGLYPWLNDYVPSVEWNFPIYELNPSRQQFYVHLGAVSAVTEFLMHGRRVPIREDTPVELLETTKRNRASRIDNEILDLKSIDRQVMRFRYLNSIAKLVEEIPIIRQVVKIELLLTEIEISTATQLAAKHAIKWGLAMSLV